MDKKITRQDITIAISTYGDRYDSALDLAVLFKKEGFEVLIVHQAEKAVDVTPSLNYVFTPTKGVAKSRNIAIATVKTKFIWFMDDDISVELEELNLFLDNIENNIDKNCHLCCVKDESGALRKKYHIAQSLTKRNILNVGTIEIVADVNFVKQHNLRFNEKYGAGTDMPLGDESIFLAQIINAGGVLARYHDAPLVHPKESSGTKWGFKEYRSKYASFIEIYGRVVGTAVGVAFVINKAFKSHI